MNGVEEVRTSRPSSIAVPLHATDGHPDTSRRTSSAMGPPPVPSNNSLPNSPRPPTSAMMEPSLSSQAPLRHPRPLTVAELHLELEKEQESIVNRLTRELSALRAQTASVASTTSSTSDLFTSTTSHPLPEYSYPGTSIIPTSARRHRSSSNLSARSARSARETLQNANSTSVSGVAAPREADRSLQTSARQSLDIQRPDTSRQNSYGLGLSATSTSNPYRSTSSTAGSYAPPAGLHSHRSSTAEARSPSFSSAQAAARYEEAAIQRQELETVKKENEALKQKIRDLEKRLTESTAD